MPEPKKRQRNIRKKTYDDEYIVDGHPVGLNGANGFESREDGAVG